jgi:hypothetical protein
MGIYIAIAATVIGALWLLSRTKTFDIVPSVGRIIGMSGGEYILVPKGIVERLPYIHPATWSAVICGADLLDAARMAVPRLAQKRLWTRYPVIFGEHDPDARTLQATSPRGTLPTGGVFREIGESTHQVPEISWLEVISRAGIESTPMAWLGLKFPATLPGALFRQQEWWNGFGDAGYSFPAVLGDQIGLSCWPPAAWQDGSTKKLWYAHWRGWMARRPIGWARLSNQMSEHWLQVQKDFSVNPFRGDPEPKYKTVAHFGFKPEMPVFGDAPDDPTGAYLLSCTIAASMGFLPGGPAVSTTFDDFTKDVVSRAFNQPIPETESKGLLAGLQIAGPAVALSFKSPMIGAIAGAVSVASYLIERRGPPPGNIGMLWHESWEPVAVHRKVLGSAVKRRIGTELTDIRPTPVAAHIAVKL